MTTMTMQQPHQQTNYPEASSFREALLVSKSKMDRWVELEKERVDVLEERYRVELERRQSAVNESVAQLLALEFQAGLRLAQETNTVDDGDHRDDDKVDDANAAGGITERRLDSLERRKSDVSKEIDDLKRAVASKKSLLQGNAT